MSLSMQVHGQDLREVSLKLRRMGDGKEIRKKFSRDLRAAAGPMVPAVRASIAAIPAKGPRSTGLRQQMSRATRLKVRTVGRQASVAILVDPKKMPDGQKALPQLMEGLREWRKPVFGNRDVWRDQDPHPYFFKTVRPIGITSRIAVAKVVREIDREIT